jgi:hypothetical protein
MTLIEQALYLDGRAHWISAFDWSTSALLISLHPFERPAVLVKALFDKPRLISRDDSYGDTLQLPWDIIGFESKPLLKQVWQFCLHSDCVEYIFESAWPAISRVNMSESATLTLSRQ